MHCESSSVVVLDCLFLTNTAGSGAGAWLEGTSRPVFRRCSFEGNSASGMGGAVATDAGVDLQLLDCEFDGNVGSSGGAICIAASGAGIRGCSITGSVAEFGGGICMMSATGVAIARTTIELGEASFQGGGLYASDSSFDVCGSTVTGNDATIQGGGVFLLNSGASFDRCAIGDNWSGGAGGGLYVNNSDVVVSASEISGNGVAVHVQGYARSSVDARWNWWGDASGPYHPTANPSGSGDEVTGGVHFEPWNATSSCEELPAAVRTSWGSIKAAYRGQAGLEERP